MAWSSLLTIFWTDLNSNELKVFFFLIYELNEIFEVNLMKSCILVFNITSRAILLKKEIFFRKFISSI